MLDVRTTTTAVIDDKGRLSLPIGLRRALEVRRDGFLVLHCFRGAIWAWTLDDFRAKIEARYRDDDPFDPGHLDFVHAVLATNEEVEIDKAGRIRIPPELREQAGITREVRVFSVLDRLEIWDVEAWKARSAAALATGSLPPRRAAEGEA